MQAIVPYKEAVEAIAAVGGEALKQCYQCGLCTASVLGIWLEAYPPTS